MQTTYRVIQFLPNPVRPLRIPFAALVQAGESLEVVTATPLPGPEILGRKESSAVLQMIIERLRGTQDFDRLPATVGPHAVLDPPRVLSAGVHDPTDWVRRFVLPHYGP